MTDHKKNIISFIKAITGISVLLFSMQSISQSSCREVVLPNKESEAQSIEQALIQIYCQIKRKGKGGSLPNIQEFKRNPVKVQRILLKNKARRLGIKLPEITTPSKPDSEEPSKPLPRQALPEASSLQDQDASRRVILDTIEKLETLDTGLLEQESSVPPPSLSDRTLPPALSKRLSLPASCVLDKIHISCAGDLFILQENLSRRALSADMLSEENTYEAPEGDSKQLDVLLRQYQYYIKKMLEIGLADATYSFTRYKQLHELSEDAGTPFAGRLRDTYELLKKERQQRDVKRRYSTGYPPSMDSCLLLSPNTIVCDNIKQNWIYSSGH